VVPVWCRQDAVLPTHIYYRRVAGQLSTLSVPRGSHSSMYHVAINPYQLFYPGFKYTYPLAGSDSQLHRPLVLRIDTTRYVHTPLKCLRDCSAWITDIPPLFRLLDSRRTDGSGRIVVPISLAKFLRCIFYTCCPRGRQKIAISRESSSCWEIYCVSPGWGYVCSIGIIRSRSGGATTYIDLSTLGGTVAVVKMVVVKLIHSCCQTVYCLGEVIDCCCLPLQCSVRDFSNFRSRCLVLCERIERHHRRFVFEPIPLKLN
jgi:hypothetical protein